MASVAETLCRAVSTPFPNVERSDPARLLVALLPIIVFSAALLALKQAPVADERLHVGAVQQMAAGDWSWPAYLPMFPTWHAVVARLLQPFGATLAGARLVSVLCAVLSVLLLWRAEPRLPGGRDGRLLTLVVWQPLMFSFWPMAYTESATMLCVCAALFLHVRRRCGWASFALFLAFLMRQSNIIWLALQTVWTWTEAVPQPDTRPRRSPRKPASQWLPSALLLLVAGVVFLRYGGVRTGELVANRPRLNVAQFVCFGVAIALLWAPLWPAVTAALRDRARGSAARVKGMLLVAAVTAAATTMAVGIGFNNPHPWNQLPGYLRNEPLTLMQQYLVIRWVGAVVVGGAAALLLLLAPWATQRWQYAAAIVACLAFLAPQPLAEPRYYILPFLFLHLALQLPPRTARILEAWYLLLGLAAGAYTLAYGSPTGGVW